MSVEIFLLDIYEKKTDLCKIHRMNISFLFFYILVDLNVQTQ